MAVVDNFKKADIFKHRMANRPWSLCVKIESQPKRINLHLNVAQFNLKAIQMISVLLISALIFAAKNDLPRTANEDKLIQNMKLELNDLEALGIRRIAQGKISDKKYAEHISRVHKSTVKPAILKFIWESYQQSAKDAASSAKASKKVTDLMNVLSQNPENKGNGVLKTAKQQRMEVEHIFGVLETAKQHQIEINHIFAPKSARKANPEEQKSSKVLDDAKSKMETSKKAKISLDSKPKKDGLFDKVKDLLNFDSKPKKDGLFDTFKSKDLLTANKKPGFMDKFVNAFKPKALSSPHTMQKPKGIEPRPI